jgi:hypothetical protein
VETNESGFLLFGLGNIEFLTEDLHLGGALSTPVRSEVALR